MGGAKRNPGSGTHRGRSPARGAGKQTYDSGDDRVLPNEGHQLEQLQSGPKPLTEQMGYLVDSSSHYILGVGVPALVASTIVL